jgi:YVTN family beta-propeller protein
MAVAAALAVAAAGASAAPLLWATNASKGAVSAFDTSTGKVVGASVAAGQAPFAETISPDGRTLYVANSADETITAIDTATRRAVATISVEGHPAAIAISPDGKLLFATTFTSGRVAVIGTGTDRVVADPSVGSEPWGIAVSPDGSRAYVGTESGSVVVLDGRTGMPTGKSIPVGGKATELVFTPDGKTAYAVFQSNGDVAVINTALGVVTDTIRSPVDGTGLAMAPDGRHLYMLGNGGLATIDTGTGEPVGLLPFEYADVTKLAISPDGKTAVIGIGFAVGSGREGELLPVDLAANTFERPILFGGIPGALLFATDQSPTASFAAPDAIVGVPTTFSGAASTDPDGAVAAWNWTFGDGGTATGPSPSHTYGAAGTYAARLSVVDEEGCGEAEVFTGRFALCSGGASSVTNPVVAAAPSLVSAAPSNKFRFGRLVHNTKNGTVRLQMKLPAAGSIVLAGPKVHMVRKKTGAAGSLWLTIHARVELNKQLKTIHRKVVKVRITFTPTGGTAKTTHRSITLLHAARKKK